MENKTRYQFDRLPMVLFLACLAVTVVAGKLTTDDKENGDSKYIIQKTTKFLKFQCKADSLAEQNKIVWSKYDDDGNKINIESIKSLEGRYEIKAKEGTLEIHKVTSKDVGNYSCSVDDKEQIFIASEQLFIKITDNIYVVEEEKIDITCNARGTVSVSWTYRRENETDDKLIKISSGERYTLNKFEGVEDARLQIDKAEMSDRGYYTCIGNNFQESKNATTLVRVKDKLAALWPFLGICAEVFVLCAIILIYEKRRNKTDLDESDTDQSPDQKNDHHKDSDVRHRK